MPRKRPTKETRRSPLTKERVLRAAVALADDRGLASLSMRKLAEKLRVEAMSLYNHVADKDDLLDGMADLVVSEIDVPAGGGGWKAAMRRRAISARAVLLRHPWAPALIESRVNAGPARLRYFDAVLGTLRRAGFSVELAYNAFLTLDSYIYGFTLHEVSWPFGDEERPEVVESLRPQVPASAYPYIAEVMGYVMESSGATPGYQAEFELGLDLILDGLERARAAR